MDWKNGWAKTAYATLAQIRKETTQLGDLRKIAKEVKKDHALAMELWSTSQWS